MIEKCNHVSLAICFLFNLTKSCNLTLQDKHNIRTLTYIVSKK